MKFRIEGKATLYFDFDIDARSIKDAKKKVIKMSCEELMKLNQIKIDKEGHLSIDNQFYKHFVDAVGGCKRGREE